MFRRSFLKACITAASPSFAFAKPDKAPAASIQRNASRPNILWITCEDMSPRLGCYGDKTVPTPNIDRLAREGVLYRNAFATTAVCAPSRHALITGMYPTSTYAFHMRNQSRTSALDEIQDPQTRSFAATRPLYEAVPPPEVRCLTEYLRQAGYYCTNNSKEDYQFQPPVTAWDESSKQAHWRKRNPDQPFFSVFNFTVTHESGVFGNGRSPKTVDPQTVPIPPYYPDNQIVREDLAKHYDNIAALDAQVGELIGQLEDDSLLDETIIFFFSDHGDGLPRSKRWVYDSGVRTPLIVRFPDKRRAGSQSGRLVNFTDFMPTVLSLAGVNAPGYVHGVPFLGEQEGTPRQYVCFHRDRNGENRETIRAIRDTRYKYIRNYRPNEPYIKPLAYRDRQAIMKEINRAIEQGALSEDQWQFSARAKPLEEFYDLNADPFEIHNLASDPRHFSKMSEMRAALHSWIEQCKDPLDLPEDELVRTRVYPPDGRQPATANPIVQAAPLREGKLNLAITCDTEGASIGFRLHKREEANLKKESRKPWTIYSDPVTIPAADWIEAVAHRIGYKPSERVRVELFKK
ncbi:MAG: sulfatase family protein [Candidatus Hinthialibacter sp.]